MQPIRIQKYLLKPWNHIQGEGKLVSDDEGNCTLKERKDSLKIEVEDIFIFPPRSFLLLDAVKKLKRTRTRRFNFSCFLDTRNRRVLCLGGLAVETLIYDLVLEASMRANNFQAKSLQIHGVWKWLLNEFASYYGVTNAYTKLRYLSYIMNVATPTKECLELICVLLLPVLKARDGKCLTRQETAAAKRWRRHLVDTEEFMSSNCDVAEPTTISAAYTKMKTLCLHICKEIQSDIKIQNQNILPRY
ncbi:hypothetical protein AXF42_Ash008902 [Apostasia shenzhenica]|uniref:Uncharacterized protein n=1 Tax=Apostasia shenzhenica TaxID=1088818 RepID=A0A2I0ASU1_9ASPA|nr:hypothetical protein AXF42_Ash008902 [Apostasia shenzhenica]